MEKYQVPENQKNSCLIKLLIGNYHILQRMRHHHSLTGLFFQNFLPEVGGRLRIMVSGGAPISQETMEFIKVCFGCVIIQGYGLTETCGMGTFQDPTKFSTNNVGIPGGSNEIKLVDVSEMGYTSKDFPCPRGEICIRGNNVTMGYFKDQKKTDECFEKDGWFHTGDVGQWNKDGTLSIIDRKKNLVKMAHGEYVALENLESIYGASPFVFPNGLMMYGDSFKDNIVAVMLPHPQYLTTWASENGCTGSISELAKNEKVIKAVLKSFQELGNNAKKKKFEFISSVRIVTGEWTPENGLLTSSMKLKRQDIKKFYENEIEEMYKELKE